MSNEIRVPDIGDFADVDVIEVLIKAGDTVSAGQSVLVLESDKASMEVPSEISGTVSEVLVKVGDKVKEGVLIAKVSGAGAAPAAPAKAEPAPAPAAAPAAPAPAPAPAPAAKSAVTAANAAPAAKIDEAAFASAHATPSIRKFARELGVDLGKVKGTARNGRISEEDVKAFVKQALAGGAGAGSASLGGGLDLLPWPKVDFSKFGPVETKELPRIKKISGQNLSRNWVMIPHVTVNENADMTELEAFRQTLNKEWKKRASRYRRWPSSSKPRLRP